MEKWPKETVAQLRERVWRAIVDTGLQDATPEERAALMPTIRDFKQREKDKEGLAERNKAAQRALQVRLTILGLIATVVVGAAAVVATIVASHNSSPIIIQAAPSSTPYPTATPH